MALKFSLWLFHQFLTKFTSNYQPENGFDWIKILNHSGLPRCQESLTASIVLDLGNYGRILNLSRCLTRPLFCGWVTAAPFSPPLDFLSWSSRFSELYTEYRQLRPPGKYLRCREKGTGGGSAHLVLQDSLLCDVQQVTEHFQTSIFLIVIQWSLALHHSSSLSAIKFFEPQLKQYMEKKKKNELPV